MAETYIPYGEEQIEYAPLVKNMADDVVNYVDQQPWSAKRKNRFMEAYSDIVSNGIIGADNKSGQWAVNLRGNIDTNSMSKKDRDIYQEAAYYILQKMKGAPIKKDTEKEDKKNLQLYDNDWHQKAITGYIGNNMFGGQNWDYTTQWDTLDKRDEKTGLLGTSNRMTKLADMLEGYGKSLEEGKYNFEGTAFKDLNDLKSRINDAVTALRGGVLDQNVIDALNRVGIDYRTYLHDGSDEQITLQDGTTVTRGQYLKALQEQEAAANQQKLLAQKQQDIAKQKASLGVLDLVSGVHAVEVKTNPDEYSNRLAQIYGVGEKGFNAINQRVQTLLNKGKGLTSKDKKELGNLLYYIRANNPNYQKSNITDQEWAELNIHKNLGSNNRAGFVRLPWQSNGRYTFADDKGNVYFLKPQKHQKLAAPIQRSNISNYRKNFLLSPNQKALQTTIGENGVTSDMYADLAALGLDAVSAGTAFIPEVGTALSAVTGIGATIAGAVGDIIRGESLGSILGSAGFGLGMDVVGLIPGVGIGGKAAKMAKVISKGAKWIGPGLQIYAARAYGPKAISAFNKMTSGKTNEVTAEELRDLTYALRAIVLGGVRKAGSTYQNNRTLARAQKDGRLKINSSGEPASITTRNEQRIKLTDEEFKTLKSNASRETKIKTINAAAQRGEINLEGDEIQWKGINPIKGRFKTSSKSSKLSGLNAPQKSSAFKWSTTSKDYKGWRRFSNENILRNYTRIQGPDIKGWQWIKNRWTGKDIYNPKVENNVSTTSKPSSATPKPNPKPTSEPASESNSATSKKEEFELPKEYLEFELKDFNSKSPLSRNQVVNRSIMNRYKKVQSGEFSKRNISDGKMKIGKENVGVYRTELPDGKEAITITTSTGSHKFETTQEAKKFIADIVKQQNKNILRTSTNKVSVKDMGKLLQDLKRKGWLKRGGIIQKDSYTLISEFLNKQK